MSNLTRFLTDRYDLYDCQVRFFEELERRTKMFSVSDNTVIKFNGVKQIDVNSEYSLSDQHHYWELRILTDDFTVYEGIEYSKKIKRVIFSDLYTIVIWNDGTKTIVKCTDEKFDKEKGLAMCIAKKSLGNKGKYYDVFKKWIKEE